LAVIVNIKTFDCIIYVFMHIILLIAIYISYVYIIGYNKEMTVTKSKKEKVNIYFLYS